MRCQALDPSHTADARRVSILLVMALLVADPAVHRRFVPAQLTGRWQEGAESGQKKTGWKPVGRIGEPEPPAESSGNGCLDPAAEAAGPTEGCAGAEQRQRTGHRAGLDLLARADHEVVEPEEVASPFGGREGNL